MPIARTRAQQLVSVALTIGGSTTLLFIALVAYDWQKKRRLLRNLPTNGVNYTPSDKVSCSLICFSTSKKLAQQYQGRGTAD
jgi:hypothetical protein